jgi:hypothetical protein
MAAGAGEARRGGVVFGGGETGADRKMRFFLDSRYSCLLYFFLASDCRIFIGF